MKSLHPLPWLALAVLLLAGGCGGGGSDSSSNVALYDTQIQNTYQDLARVIEARDLGGLMSLVSTSYLQQGVDYQGFQATFGSLFQNYRDVQFNYQLQSVEYDNNQTPLYARVSLRQQILGTNLNTGARDVIDDANRQAIWRLENGRWRLFGDQSSVRTQSLDLKSKLGGLLGSTIR